eukprot:443058-Pyramimonas_sp.AAC.1
MQTETTRTAGALHVEHQRGQRPPQLRGPPLAPGRELRRNKQRDRINLTRPSNRHLQTHT